MKKRIISLLLVVSTIFSCTFIAFAGENTINAKNNTERKQKENAQVEVYTIDEKGNKVKLDIPVEFFTELANNGTASLSGVVTPSIIPDPEEDVSRISDPYYGSFTNEDVNFAIQTAVASAFGVAWTKLGGLLKALGVNTLISSNLWNNIIFSNAVSTAVGNATDFAKVDPTYYCLYQYKQYSSYWDCYEVMQVTIYYGSDSTHTNPTAVFVMPVKYEYWQVGY